MPVEVTTDIIVLNQPEFHALAAKLLRIIFDVHNEFGRFLDEALYKNEIAARWTAAGHGLVGREIQINVSHKTFRKSYFMTYYLTAGCCWRRKWPRRWRRTTACRG